jgi:hypothetical protein
VLRSAAMPLQVLQRPDWHGTPVDLADCWRLGKSDGCRAKQAVCRLFNHRFGWELRLEINGEFVRSEVCRDQEAVLSTFETWKAAMIEKGWR